MPIPTIKVSQEVAEALKIQFTSIIEYFNDKSEFMGIRGVVNSSEIDIQKFMDFVQFYNGTSSSDVLKQSDIIAEFIEITLKHPTFNIYWSVKD